MSPEDRERFREQLLEMGKQVQREMSGLAREVIRTATGEASGSTSGTPMHLADLGTDLFEQELSASLLENRNRTLDEIAAAIARLNAGTFGACENCGKSISKERLQAVPQTRYCIECAREMEKNGVAPGPTGP